MAERTSDAEPEERIEAMTAREALLGILWLLAAEGAPGGLAARVRVIAEEGLARDGIENFQLSDQLADRLAEAHRLLREVSDGVMREELVEGKNLAQEIGAALALPPDLEAMVDRRIGHG